ncbi:MAG: S-adenosylmethionine:tRNA ribosyltransferase-isomerase [Myxococcota bacterium]
MRAAPLPRPHHLTRLLVIDPAGGRWADRSIADLAGLLDAGDLVIVNDAATFPASLSGWTSGGEAIEVRLLGPPAGESAGARADAVVFEPATGACAPRIDRRLPSCAWARCWRWPARRRGWRRCPRARRGS